MKKTSIALLLTIAVTSVFAYGTPETKATKKETVLKMNIVDTAVAAGNFKTLATCKG